MTIDEVADHFKPTVSNTKSKPYDLMRILDWTTNGFYLMNKKIEPSMIREVNNLREIGNHEDFLKKLKELIQQYDEASKNPLELHNCFKFIGGSPCVLLKNGKYHAWVNAYFLALFAKSNYWRSFSFYQRKQNKAIYVTLGEEVVGMIMPVLEPR